MNDKQANTQEPELVDEQLAEQSQELVDEPDEDVEEGFTVDEEAANFYWEDPPDLQFEDIGGYPDIKDGLQKKVIKPDLGQTDLYEKFNVEPASGILLHGPPGTGKTMFARALANSLGRDYIELSQADLTHNHINKSGRIIKQLFVEAQDNNGVVLIDEADILFGDRANDANHTEDSKVTNTFLRYMSLEDTNFIIILTTNARDSMDAAATRSGRIDVEFEVGLPNKEARIEIIKLELLDVPHDLTINNVRNVAKHTEGLSGADLVSIIENSKFVAIDRKADHMNFSDLQGGYKQFKAMKKGVNK